MDGAGTHPRMFSVSPKRGIWRQSGSPFCVLCPLSPEGKCLGFSKACLILSGVALRPTFLLAEIFLARGMSTQKCREDEEKKELPELEARMGPEFY